MKFRYFVDENSATSKHELDVVAVQGKQVTFLGEAKNTLARRGVPDLERLEGIKLLLERLGFGVTNLVFGIFSRTGFTSDLEHLASTRPDVELVSLDRLYGVQ